MSGGEPSSIKQNPLCAAEPPVSSDSFPSKVWPFASIFGARSCRALQKITIEKTWAGLLNLLTFSCERRGVDG